MSVDGQLFYGLATSLPETVLMQVIAFSGMKEPCCRNWLRPYRAMLADPQQLATWLTVIMHSKDEALVCAAIQGSTGAAGVLLGRGADLRFENGAPLNRAAAAGHLEVVRLLLDHGGTTGTTAPSDPNVVQAFRMSARHGHLLVVQLLLQRRASLFAVSEVHLAMVDAAQDGHVEVVRWLLDEGADAHADVYEAVRLAAGEGCIDVVMLLLDRVNGLPDALAVALSSAAMSGHVQLASLLLDRGAGMMEGEGGTLYMAVDSEETEAVRLLLERGQHTVADLNVAYMLALDRGSQAGLAIASLLADHTPVDFDLLVAAP